MALDRVFLFLEELRERVDVVLVQEHWCAPFDLQRLHDMFTDMVCFASSAMTSVVSESILRGRPFGGVATFINSKYAAQARLVVQAERFIIVRLFGTIIVNVYMPCSSQSNYNLLYEDTLSCIENALCDFRL